MDFWKNLESQVEQINMLKLHYKVCLNKGKHQAKCNELAKVTAEVKELLEKFHSLMDEIPTVKEEFERDMEKAHRQKMLMMRIMDVLDDERRNQEDELSSMQPSTPLSKVLRERNFSTPGSSFRLHRLPPPQSVGRTPSSVLRDTKSPFRRRTINPTDFNYTISSKLFEQIPRYLRGRDTLEDLQTFLNTVIIKSLVEKYRMLSKCRNTIALRDRNLYDLFHDQENDFPNKLFITQGDISRIIGKMIDKRCSSRLQMLRHIRILQEVRKKSTIYYFWLLNDVAE